MPVSAKSRQILKAAGRGQATSAMMEAIIRGMQSSHGKKNLARENDGAKFVGPKTRTPTYKTGKGVSRLLGEASMGGLTRRAARWLHDRSLTDRLVVFQEDT